MIFRLGAARIIITISAFASLTLSGFPSDTFAARVALPTIPGIWCSREPGRTLSIEQRQLLTRSLGRITGWEQIQFSAYGSLVLDEVTAAHGGSPIARQVLTEVLRSGSVFVLENPFQSHPGG